MAGSFPTYGAARQARCMSVRLRLGIHSAPGSAVGIPAIGLNGGSSILREECSRVLVAQGNGLARVGIVVIGLVTGKVDIPVRFLLSCCLDVCLLSLKLRTLPLQILVEHPSVFVQLVIEVLICLLLRVKIRPA